MLQLYLTETKHVFVNSGGLNSVQMAGDLNICVACCVLNNQILTRDTLTESSINVSNLHNPITRPNLYSDLCKLTFTWLQYTLIHT